MPGAEAPGEGDSSPLPALSRDSLHGRLMEAAARRAGEDLSRSPTVVVAGRRGGGRTSLLLALLRQAGEDARGDPAPSGPRLPEGIGGLDLAELPALDEPLDGERGELLLDRLCAAHACLVVAPATGQDHEPERAFVEALRAAEPRFPCLVAASRVDLLAGGPWDPAALDLERPSTDAERAIRQWGARLRERCGVSPGRFALTSTGGNPRDPAGFYGLNRLARLLVDAMPAALQAQAARSLRVETDRGVMARRVIRSAAAATMAAALTPAPLVDVVGITASQLGMLVALARLYGADLSPRDAARLIMGTGWRGLPWAARWAIESAPKWIPGVGTVAGGMLEATMEAPLTMALGETYLELLARRECTPNPAAAREILRGRLERVLQERESEGRLAWARRLREGGVTRLLGRRRARSVLDAFGRRK